MEAEDNPVDVGLSEPKSESTIDMSAFNFGGIIQQEEEDTASLADEFFTEDLVWPDPEKVFGRSSGIKPAILTADLRELAAPTEMEDVAPLTLCQKVRQVKKPPRPKDLPWNVLIIGSDPPIVDIDDVEEFLVHDPLFVEFFNAFLSLPSFPEPICFNVETGGFEVVSDGKQKLAQQIKEAVRSQNLTAKMYRVARQHAFSDIPLIPIEDTQGPEEVKIDTSFQVTTLNKDQGIYWIKAERLPIFLESDYYFQYRLAKVISQARVFNDKGEFIIMKIDFTARPKKKKTSVEVPPPNLEETIMKEMFVSFGDVKGAAKEAWFCQAKDELKIEPTFTTITPKVSLLPSAPVPPSKDAIKPDEKSSVFHSQYFGVYSPGLMGPNDGEPPIKDETIVTEGMFTCREKPFTPRPSDKIHSSTSMLRKKISKQPGADEEMVAPGSVVFMWPKQDLQSTDTESGIGDMDEKDEEFEKRMIAQPILDEIYNDGSWEEGGSGIIPLNSIDELGSVIVGAVMKKTVAELLKTTEKNVIADPTISSIYPTEELTCVSVDKLDMCMVVKNAKPVSVEKLSSTVSTSNTTSSPQVESSVPSSETDNSSQVTADKENSSAKQGKVGVKIAENQDQTQEVPDKVPPHIKWNKPMPKPAEEESDADSLLDSDEDFEERDLHFRRKKDKWHSLTSLKGIMAFKKFLAGTQGEKYWELWIDIDKIKLIHDEEDKQRYTMHMRERYYKKGSPFELSAEDKKKLGLENLASWCPEYLTLVHSRVLEPLVLYWAPRYLLKHLLRTHPEKYYLYNQMKSSLPIKESDPHPHTQALLPLRPKSCCPRTRQGPEIEEMNFNKNWSNLLKSRNEQNGTTPKVGNRRVFGEDTLQRLMVTPTAKYIGIKPPAAKRPATASQAGQQRRETATNKASVSSGISTGQSFMKSRLQSQCSDSSVVKTPQHHSGTRSVSYADRPETEPFIGKLPGVVTPSTAAMETGDVSNTDGVHRRSSTAVSNKRVCPSKNLDSILGDFQADRPKTAGPQLGPVKKPKDLLSPMLRIVDTKGGKYSRVQSAPPRKSASKGLTGFTFYRQDSQDSSKVCDLDSAMYGSLEGTEELPIAEMRDCDFMGSERMEFLLQALHHEQDSGRTFRKYVEKSDRADWINNLDFWEKVQEYRKLFYKDKLDLHLIAKQAKSIFAQCIVEGAPISIGVSESIELQIMDRLSPAYEDLFDEAEEHALKVLFEVFQRYLSQDVKTYCKVERAEITRRLETKNTYILNLQKKGIIKERPLTPDDPMEGYVDPVYDDSVLERIPEQFRDWTLDKLIHNRLELEHFRHYLIDNYAEIDLKCWMDIEAWRRTPHEEAQKRDQRARDIKKNYLNKKYFFGPSSPAGKEGQNKVMEVGGGWGKFLEDKPHSASILEAQKYVRERLEKKHLPLFLLTKEFQERQSPPLSMADSAEDVIVQKKRRSQLVTKQSFTSKPDIQEEKLLLESKWISSAKEIFMFQRGLQNRITCIQFQKFVSLQGENLENDVLFWLEVQKYKQMHHSHTEDVMLQQKISAIVQCFIDSPIPPALQIDIPQDMADRILDHKHEKGPYLFREAQLATFRILLQYWQPFCEFRANMGSDDKAMKTLERHRAIARKKEMDHRAEVEQQREKEQQEQLLSIPKSKKSLATLYKERLYRLEHGLTEGEDLGHDIFDEYGDRDKVSFSYADYLAEQAQEDAVKFVNVSDRGTQTYRSKESLENIIRRDSTKSDKGTEKGNESTADKENTSVSRRSSQTEKRRSSEISGVSKRGEQGDQVKESLQKVKNSSKTDRPVSAKGKPHTGGTMNLIELNETAQPKKSGRRSPPVVKAELAE